MCDAYSLGKVTNGLVPARVCVTAEGHPIIDRVAVDAPAAPLEPLRVDACVGLLVAQPVVHAALFVCRARDLPAVKAIMTYFQAEYPSCYGKSLGVTKNATMWLGCLMLLELARRRNRWCVSLPDN